MIPRIGSWLSVPSSSNAGAAEVLALGKNLLAALRILRRCVAPSDDLLRSGREQLQGA